MYSDLTLAVFSQIQPGFDKGYPLIYWQGKFFPASPEIYALWRRYAAGLYAKRAIPAQTS